MNLIENLRLSIYQLMRKNNMTCQEFGDALGYPITDVDRILFGEVLLPPVEIEKIAKLFGMTKQELMYYQDIDDGTKIDIEIMTENPNMYVNLKELVERFIEIDEYYNHEPWNIKQIIANINLIIPIEIGEDHEKEKKN